MKFICFEILKIYSFYHLESETCVKFIYLFVFDLNDMGV